MTRFLDSTAPFNPINPHGARAKVPDGWKNPFKEPRYRVHVDTPQRESQPITPGMGRLVIDELHSKIQAAIKSGKLTDWSNPHVRPV